MPHSSAPRGPGLYEFLIEAELQQYYSTIKNDLKVNNVHQLKYATDEDFFQVGLSRPEVRRLRKVFHKHCPQNYLYKFKNIIKSKKEDCSAMAVLLPEDGNKDRAYPLKVPSKHIIPAEAIVVNKELGVGEFGVVQQGVWTNEDGDRIQVAIKCLSKERMQNNPMEFLKEAAIMHTIDHEHIVRLYGVVLDTNSLMLVTELAPLRSLLECLKEPALRPSFPVPSLCDFAIQICDGMQYLESKRLIHRDLAARNILVFSKNKIKISDFGLSRALGVGKDYYQTNFNVNLKLPIAWCAPECINYLKFTSASDVWAFGVTLWEMFSYGFQPWAALTGQQILEAIDEPNYQRLEPPESAPKDYYSIMLKCWQHEPHNRPRFIDLMTLLPECKPEQVQAIQDSIEDLSKRRDQLLFRIGDVITVLDKKPLPDVSNTWKGILNNGKTGLFNPAHTVAYLGNILPSIKPQFTRGDGKNAYSSKRRLRPEMISSPQGDLKHTGHVGLDGAYFGDVSFLGDKYHQLPKQVVAPYKPQDDCPSLHSNGNGASLDVPLTPSPGPASPMCGPPSAFSINSASSDISDRAPLLARIGDRGRAGPAADHNWSDTASEKDGNSAPPTPGFLSISHQKMISGNCKAPGLDLPSESHEYHEISDEDVGQSPGFDLGPSLMDEVLRALGGGTGSVAPSSYSPHLEKDYGWKDDSGASNSLPGSKRGTLKDTLKKKQATVKPISASDQRTLDQAIAMANELASRSMLDLDSRSSTVLDHFSVDHAIGPIANMSLDSPHTPSSPSKRKFSFKFSGRTSPRHERRNFTEEAASISDIQSTLSEESKEVYNMLIEKPALDVGSGNSSSHGLATPNEQEDSNPLRMLRSGGLTVVRPKIRGNKHQSVRESRELKETNLDGNISTYCSRIDRGKLGAPPVSPKTRVINRPSPLVIENSNFNHYRPPMVLENGHNSSSGHPNIWINRDITQTTAAVYSHDSVDANNPLPLPPRDRTRPIVPTKPRHQRKHPLILPTNLPNQNRWAIGSDTNSNPESPMSPSVESNGSPEVCTLSAVPPAKPPRACNLDDSYDSQIASELEALDDMEEETANSVTSGSSLYQSKDHVSCEDLLDFACDRPNSKRTRGPAQGTDSDEVRIMQKVLGKEKTVPAECLAALDEAEWDVHKAIKLVKLRSLLSTTHSHLTHHSHLLKSSLNLNSWDVARAAAYLISQAANTEDCTRV